MLALAFGSNACTPCMAASRRTASWQPRFHRGVHVPHDTADQSALIVILMVREYAGTVAAFKQDDYPQSLGFDPSLQRAQLGLQTLQFSFVVAAFQLSAGVIVLVLLRHA